MLLLTFALVGFTDELRLVSEVEFQPFASATQRLIEALDYLGSPLSEDDLSASLASARSRNRCAVRVAQKRSVKCRSKIRTGVALAPKVK